MGIKRGFLGFLSVLFMSFFVANAFAVTYSCPTFKKYTTCNAGYYMTDSSGTYNGTPAVGNSCTICPKGSYCEGGTKNKVACPAGRYGSATGLKTSACSGVISAGYYSTGGATSSTPTAAGNGCLSGYSCGKVGPGRYSTGGGTSSTPTAAGSGCLSGYSCGAVSAGYYSTGGGTSSTPTAVGSGCLSGASCGKVSAGYYNTGCGSDYNGSVCSSSYSGGTIAAGRYGVAGATTAQGSGAVNKGYYSTGGGTSATPTAAGSGCLSGYSCGKVSKNCFADTTGSTSACPKSCTSLGAFYTTTASTGSTSSTDCYGATTAGKYIKTQYSSTQETCPAGSYCPATYVNYGDYDTSGGRSPCASAYVDGYNLTDKFTSDPGTTSASSCYIYLSGELYDLDSDSDPIPCPEGYYCASGKYLASDSNSCQVRTINGTNYDCVYGDIQACPTSHPNSDAGTDSSDYCYVSKTKTGVQNPCSKPTGAKTYTCNSCTPGTCSYRDYYVADDKTCTPSNCNQTATATSCVAGYYLSNGTCKPASDLGSGWTCPEGNTGAGQCYRSCTTSDVSNSGAVSGKFYYGATAPSSCVATSCKNNTYLSAGACSSCGTSYPYHDNDGKDGTYCWKTCADQTGYTKSGRDYNGATDTCSYSANCNQVTINPYCGSSSEKQYIYKKTDTTGWYSDSNCTTSVTSLTSTLATCTGWTQWGVSPSQSDTTSDNSGSGLYFTADGKTTTAGTNWTINAPATLYIVRAKPCAAGTGCSCSLSVSNAGAVNYTTGAQTGYTLSSGNDTYAPTCSANTYTITLNDNNGTGGSGTAKEVYANKWTNSSGTTITSVAIPTRSGYVFKGYYTETTGGTQRITAAGALPGNTTFTANTTLYAQWSQCTCTNDTSATECSATVSNNVCNITWSCKSGYYKATKSASNSGGGYTATCDSCTTNAGSAYTASNGNRDSINTCYKSCTRACTQQTAPANSCSVTHGSSSTSGIQQYNSSTCSASSSNCTLTLNYCNDGYYTDGGSCSKCPTDFPLTDKTGSCSAETSLNECWRNCNASDVPNSTSRTGWKTYSGNNTCAATACAAGYYLENGTCKAASDLGTGWTCPAGNTGASQCYRSCTTSDVSNSGAVSGKFYYGATAPSSCVATSCKNNTYLSAGACSSCGTSYPYHDNDGKDGTYCWKACADQTGYTKSGRDYNGATDTCSYSANTYTITLDDNNGSGGSGTAKEVYNTKWTNSSGTTISSVAIPTRTGYTFKGYYTAASGGTQRITSAGALPGNTTFTANTTLYAQWTPNTYKVTLDKQSGTGGTSEYYYQYNTVGTCYYYTTDALSECTKDASGSPSNITIPTRTGYTFGGYYTGTNGTGTQYVNANGGTINSLYSASAANITLYAKWTANKFTVNFNGNSQTSGSPSVSSVECTYDSACTAATMNTLAKTKKVFLGWSTSSTATSATYSSGGSIKNISTGSAVTLYAVWKEPTCSAGTGVNTTSLNSVSGNAPVCNRSSKDGYYCSATQTGSAGATSLTVTCTAAGDGYYAKAGATTQTACAQGSYSSASSASSSCTACPGGRTTSGTGTKYNATANTACSVTCTNNSGVYAWKTPSWSVNSVSNLCTVQSCNGGTSKESNACSTCPSGYTSSNGMTNAAAYCYKTCASKTGYTLTSGVDYYSATDTCTYSANKFTVNFNGNSQTSGSPSVSSVECTYDSACTAATMNTLAKTKHVFLGWSTSSTATSATYASGASIKNIISSGSTTLYAVWYEPTCSAGTGVASTSLNSVSGNAPVCNRSSKDGYFCDATQTGTAGATSLTVTCTAAGDGYYAKAGATTQTACAQGSYSEKTSASSSCNACPGGRTTSGTGTKYNANANTACSVTCTNATGVRYWMTTSWSENSVSDLCMVNNCEAKYYKDSNACTLCSGLANGFYPNSDANNNEGASACYTDVLSGEYVASVGASSTEICDNWTFRPEHRVHYGSTSTCRSCPDVPEAYNGVAWNKPSGTGWTDVESCYVTQTPAGCASGTAKITATWTGLDGGYAYFPSKNSTLYGLQSVGAVITETLVSKDGYYAYNSGSFRGCWPAADGYYAKAGATRATACAEGSYSEKSSASTKCVACPAGRTTSGTGTNYNANANTACAKTCSNASGVYGWATPSWSANTVSNLCTVNTCASKYYKNSNACSLCSSLSSDYANSNNGNSSGEDACFTSCGDARWVSTPKTACTSVGNGYWRAAHTVNYGSTDTRNDCKNAPDNANYTGSAASNSCPWECNSGYNLTDDGQCGQFCTAGITKIKLSNGLSIPLYSTPRTSPAINVKVQNGTCYGSLASGQSSGALNVKTSSGIYHSID